MYWDTCLVNFVYYWTLGLSFNKLLQQPNYDPSAFSEGIFICHILRLAEACRDIQHAARIMGNPKLLQVATAAEIAIKRDICFTPSLYI
jgi:antiviral helicase SKI2